MQLSDIQDQTVHPVRGQVVVLDCPWVKTGWTRQIVSIFPFRFAISRRLTLRRLRAMRRRRTLKNLSYLDRDFDHVRALWQVEKAENALMLFLELPEKWSSEELERWMIGESCSMTNRST